MTNNKIKSIKNYYENYYSNNYYRDIRLLGDKQLIGYDEETAKPKYNFSIKTFKVAVGTTYNDKVRNSKLFKQFLLMNRKGTGTLASEITHFRNYVDFSKHNKLLRYSDRLFLDLDTENTKAKELKKLQIEANKTIINRNERRKVIAEAQADFKELILNEHILRDTYREVNILIKYLQDKLHLKPYLIFSGSKGFHINIFFDRLQINNINKITYDLTTIFKDKLHLESLDLAVTDGKTRIQRVPYSVHERTKLTTTPIPVGTTYSELLEIIDTKPHKVKPLELNLENYYSNTDFTDTLIRLDNKIALLKIQEEKTKAKELEERRKRSINLTTNYSFSKENPFKDLRELVKHIVGESEYSTEEYNIYCCSFHNDSSPSAIVGKNVYYCFSCKATYNYWNFIKHYYKCRDNKEVAKHITRLKQEMQV